MDHNTYMLISIIIINILYIIWQYYSHYWTTRNIKQNTNITKDIDSNIKIINDIMKILNQNINIIKSNSQIGSNQHNLNEISIDLENNINEQMRNLNNH